MLHCMTDCDLALLYGKLVERLPISPDDDPFVFSVGTLPRPTRTLASDRLVIRKGVRNWNGCYRSDLLDLLVRPATLRQLGVLTLAVLFHAEPAASEILLTHPESQIRRFRIRYEHMSPEAVRGYWAVPSAFEYWASDPFPLIGINARPERPGLRLTDDEEQGDDWEARDTVVGFGEQAATVAMAQLMLDAAVFPYPRREYQLEGPAGNDVLEPLSADLRIVLPGSQLWDLIAIEVPE